jgi:hypothetical protein
MEICRLLRTLVQRYKRHLYHILLLSVSFGFSIFWFLRPPIPNKAVLALAAMAALMMLADMHWGYKIGYVLLVIGFVLIENQAINKDHNDQNGRFMETLSQITGGNTYPLVLAVTLEDGWHLAITPKGQYGLNNIYVSVLSHAQSISGPDFVESQRRNTIAATLPRAYAGRAMDTGLMIKPEGDFDIFRIDIAASNGSWMERLIMKRTEHGWSRNWLITNMRGTVLEDTQKEQN